MKKLKIIFSACIIIAGVITLTSIIQLQDKWEAPKSADLRKNPLKGNIAATQKGKILFEKQCAMCHGSKGIGNGYAAVDFKSKPTDLTSKMTQMHTDGALYWKIMHGEDAMPSFKKAHKTNRNSCWQLINYIRELGKQPMK